MEERDWRRLVKRIDVLRAIDPTSLAVGGPRSGPIEFTGNSLIIRASRAGRRDSLLTLQRIELAPERISAAHAEFVQTSTEILNRLVAEGYLPTPTPIAIRKKAQKRASANLRAGSALPLPKDTSPPASRPRGGRLVDDKRM
jgi:hypothetical protein